MEPIVNRVAQSGIEVFDLEAFAHGVEAMELDLAPFLYKGLILREKPFREQVAATDWSAYEGKLAHIACSVDTIIPPWTYMLLASRLRDVAAQVTVGDSSEAWHVFYGRQLGAFDWARYEDGIVVVKGCGARNVPETAYALAMSELQKVARKVMYGEPCSAVPIWRRPANPAGGSS